MSDQNVVNPGLVNVADESDGEIKINQTITVSPSSNAGPTVSVVTEYPPGRGLPSDVRAA